MRPPSYYTSIAQSNDRNSSRFGGSGSSHLNYSDLSSRTASQQLRSSLSTSSSSSYVSRSHLPYVPQSTLVAHCFTGVGSSTHPYGGSSQQATGSNSGHYLSASRTSSHHRPLSTSVRSTQNPYLTSSSSSGYSSSSSTSSSYLPTRSPYLTTSTSSSSPTSRYRPTTSSYYKPIRLRERPLLTQLSSRLNYNSGTAYGTKPSTSNDHSRTDEKTESQLVAIYEPTSNSVGDIKQQEENTWSQDVARNISRNKYLIKFREIERPNRSNLKSPVEFEAKSLTETEDTHTEISTRVDAPSEPVNDCDTMKILKDNVETLADHSDQLDLVGDKVGEKTAFRRESKTTSSPINEICDTNTNFTVQKRVKKIKKKASGSVESPALDEAKEVREKSKESKKSSETSQASVKAEPEKAEELTCSPLQAEQASKQASESCSPVKKERKNVKLKLKPIGCLKQSAAAAAATVDTNIVENDDQKAIKKDGELAKEKPKAPTKVKRLVKRKPSDDLRKAAKKSDEKVNKTITVESSDVDKENDNLSEENNRKVKLVNAEKLKLDTSKVSMLNKIKTPDTSETGSAKASRLRFRQYNYDDFNFLTVLGHGGWGFVILAELKDYDACFAVKCIKKITIVEDDDYDSIMIERRVLTLGNVNPFICKLFCTFETDGYLFFVMEYCPGGDLMFHVQREGKFTESRSRFYAAEIICAIRFLHNRHIIYRDLKLDNILLDSRGHIRLVDFGMCQCRTYREEMLPSNFCGTPEYISPEIIKGVPYNHSVDWWSFGVLLYEMAVGKMPFRGNDENELLWNVCYEQIHYPMFLSKELTELLKLLLEREPTKRMGMATCKSGDIYDQPFFRGVNWKAVEELKVEPPFIPEVTSKRDVQNFDSDFTESACELSPVDEKTLERIDQSQFQKFPYTNPDIFIFEQTPSK